MGLYIPYYFQRCHGTFQARPMDTKTERRCDVGDARANAKCETSEWDVCSSRQQAKDEWRQRPGISLQPEAPRESLRTDRQRQQDQRQPRIKHGCIYTVDKPRLHSSSRVRNEIEPESLVAVLGPQSASQAFYSRCLATTGLSDTYSIPDEWCNIPIASLTHRPGNSREKPP